MSSIDNLIYLYHAGLTFGVNWRHVGRNSAAFRETRGRPRFSVLTGANAPVLATVFMARSWYALARKAAPTT